MIIASMISIFLLLIASGLVQIRPNKFRLGYEEKSDGVFKGVIYLGFISIWIYK